jgi:hypothetical protein
MKKSFLHVVGMSLHCRGSGFLVKRMTTQLSLLVVDKNLYVFLRIAVEGDPLQSAKDGLSEMY